MYQHYPYITAILNSSPRNNQGEQARIPDSGPFRDIAWSVIQNLLPKTEEMRKLFFMDANSPSGSTFHVASSYNDLARLAAPGTYLRRCFDWAESMYREEKQSTWTNTYQAAHVSVLKVVANLVLRVTLCTEAVLFAIDINRTHR
jgi:hypothetical protein